MGNAKAKEFMIDQQQLPGYQNQNLFPGQEQQQQIGFPQQNIYTQQTPNGIMQMPNQQNMSGNFQPQQMQIPQQIIQQMPQQQMPQQQLQLPQQQFYQPMAQQQPFPFFFNDQQNATNQKQHGLFQDFEFPLQHKQEDALINFANQNIRPLIPGFASAPPNQRRNNRGDPKEYAMEYYTDSERYQRDGANAIPPMQPTRSYGPDMSRSNRH